MNIYEITKLNSNELRNILRRPGSFNQQVNKTVTEIVADVKANGTSAALKYATELDGFPLEDFRVTEEELSAVESKVVPELKKAVINARQNIRKFHEQQIPNSYSVETVPGVICSREFRPVQNVALYVPGGTAVLPSTVLMLGVPAELASCPRRVLFTPSKDGTVSDVVLFAALQCGIREIYKIGGAHGVALMAYGGKGVPKVDKIFGPGNQYVTYAKVLVSADPDGAAIDMPAGPSELLVIADESATAKFVASDLLSQAEHGADSQVILLSNSKETIDHTIAEVNSQLENLPREQFASKALENSSAILVDSIEQAITISNQYAPEHLIIHTEQPETLRSQITNAGSVFLGKYSPESAGDYASGTNHSLPTSGYAKTYAGVSVESFMKAVTFQNISKSGLAALSDSIIQLANAEGLDAHASAVKVRLTDGN